MKEALQGSSSLTVRLTIPSSGRAFLDDLVDLFIPVSPEPHVMLKAAPQPSRPGCAHVQPCSVSGQHPAFPVLSFIPLLIARCPDLSRSPCKASRLLRVNSATSKLAKDASQPRTRINDHDTENIQPQSQSLGNAASQT